jgi:hypothetical protein
MAIPPNAEFNALNLFTFNQNNVNLVVNTNEQYNVSPLSVRSLSGFLEGLANYIQNNFPNYRYGNTLSLVIVNQKYAKLSSSIFTTERGEISTCIVPYNDLDLESLNAVIVEIKSV